MAFTESERAELIAALVHTATMVEGLLKIAETLLASLRADARPPEQELRELELQANTWRRQLDILRRRLTTLTVEPPERPQ
jgi:hypothetical protein